MPHEIPNMLMGIASLEKDDPKMLGELLAHCREEISEARTSEEDPDMLAKGEIRDEILAYLQSRLVGKG